MLSGVTASAFAMAGTAVFKIVVSSDSMKKATATSHGNMRFAAMPGSAVRLDDASLDLAGTMPLMVIATGSFTRKSVIPISSGAFADCL